MNDNTEALPPLPAELAAAFIGYVEGILGVCKVPADVFDAFEARADEFRAALAQRQQVPEGWQLVPKVPTVAMNQAGALYAECAIPANADECYRAMIATAPALTAAPSAQAEPDDEPRVTAGGGFPGDHNGEKAAQAEPQVPLPFNSAQRRRLWDNSIEIHADAKSYAAFERIVQLVESAHGIGKQESK